MFPYEHKEGAETCPICERCDLTDGMLCNDCGYDRRKNCSVCGAVLIPPHVADEDSRGSFQCPKGHPQLRLILGGLLNLEPSC